MEGGQVRICLTDKRKSSFFTQRNDGTFAHETPACPAWKEKRLCREPGPKSNRDIYFFAPMIMLHWKQNTRSFFKAHKLKNLMWLCKLKTNTRVMNGPECVWRTSHLQEMMLALGLLKWNCDFFMEWISYEKTLTLPISRSLVSITTMVELCSQSIRQKSSVVSAKGPWVAM